MFSSRFNLEKIKADLSSDKQEIRGGAMQALSIQVRKDPRIHQAALLIFREALKTETDAWAAKSAARGIEHICGVQEGRRVWLDLLNRPEASLVQYIVLSMTDPFYLQPLLDLLQRRPEPAIHSNALRTLGRMKNSTALRAILKDLAIQELRADAVEALADLGDRRAIPYLQPLLEDNTDAWLEDNHGGMLRVCDLARVAIRRLGGGEQK